MLKDRSGFSLHLVVVSLSVLALVASAYYAATKSTNLFSTRASSGPQTISVSVSSSSDDINEVGVNQGSYTNRSVWLGNANSSSNMTGLRFQKVNIPAKATVNSAFLEVVSSRDQASAVNVLIKAEASANSPAFNKTQPLYQKILGNESMVFSNNTAWKTGQTYKIEGLGPIVQEIVNRDGWQPGNALSLIVRGNGRNWARKFITSFDGNPAKTAKLNVTFTVPTSEVPAPPASLPPPPPPPHTSNTGQRESMAMMAWQTGAKNSPNPKYDKCDDGTDVSVAHKQYYVVAYDNIRYPTWHPPVVNNPITGVGKCYFGHEHGTDPQKYVHWNEIVQHFGKDANGDNKITALIINPSTGVITPGDRAGLPFGIANEHMDMYYNQENRDSIFVRHEDHVGHKIEAVNSESDLINNSTHVLAQVGEPKDGVNIPYSLDTGTTFSPTGVVCTHLHKFHQGSHSGDAIRNNLHEVIFHSSCKSYDVNGINAPAYYPNNTAILTGMMSFGNPGEYVRFCGGDRFTEVCVDGKNADGSCRIDDPLISKLPPAVFGQSLGRNIVDRECLRNFARNNPGSTYFGPYEIWQGDLQITRADGTVLAEHGRQWDLLDPVRFIEVGYVHPTRSWQKDYQFNSENCKEPEGAFDSVEHVGGCYSRSENTAWDSPQSGFRGLHRTTYFGVNHLINAGGSKLYWTDPLGGNATTSEFSSGLKQSLSTVNAYIQHVQGRVQERFNNTRLTLNDRAIQRWFDDGNSTVHAPN